jgi:ribonuclease VapC
VILDTSAIVAILQYEPEAPAVSRAVENNRPVRVSAATWLEAAIVVDGNRSPALLNYEDCFSYALAWERGEPLLYKGEDFTQTDVRQVEMP